MTEKFKDLIIALDYDETFTTDPVAWGLVAMLLEKAGHNVILVTYRHEELDAAPLLDAIKQAGIDCYFTDGKAKGKFMEDLGIKVDIWIDDNPKSVLEDSAWKHDSPELHAWREENKKKVA